MIEAINIIIQACEIDRSGGDEKPHKLVVKHNRVICIEDDYLNGISYRNYQRLQANFLEGIDSLSQDIIKD